jgi:hypothetical protein
MKFVPPKRCFGAAASPDVFDRRTIAMGPTPLRDPLGALTAEPDQPVAAALAISVRAYEAELTPRVFTNCS